MTENKTLSGYRIVVKDDWLDIENFRTIEALSEEEAVDIFNERHRRGDGSKEIVDIEVVYSFDVDTVDRLIGIETLNYFSD